MGANNPYSTTINLPVQAFYLVGNLSCKFDYQIYSWLHSLAVIRILVGKLATRKFIRRLVYARLPGVIHATIIIGKANVATTW